MKLYYIAPEGAATASECFRLWHTIPLGDGNEIICGELKDEPRQLQWEADPNVFIFPHPLSGDPASMGVFGTPPLGTGADGQRPPPDPAATAAKVTATVDSTKDFGITSADNTFQVAMKMGVHCPTFKPHVE